MIPPNRIRNTDPFHESVPSFKTCKKCSRYLQTTPSNWKSQFVWRVVLVPDLDTSDELRALGQGDDYEARRRIRIPSVYCRDCSNRLRAQERDLKVWRSLLTEEQREADELERQGPCQSCGSRANQRFRILSPKPTIVCRTCQNFIEACMEHPDPITVAFTSWKDVARHCVEEERIRDGVFARTNRLKVPYHKYNPNARDILHPHVVCLAMEGCWRRALRWLKANVPAVPIDVEADDSCSPTLLPSGSSTGP
jgi:hypothetical protein